MFDIGFFELSLIGVVALVVIGPERLPSVARAAGKWIGRANRFISNIKDDISQEMKSEELQNILQEQQKLADDFKKSAQDTSSQIGDLLEIDETAPAKKKKNKKKKNKTKKDNIKKNTTKQKSVKQNKIVDTNVDANVKPVTEEAEEKNTEKV